MRRIGLVLTAWALSTASVLAQPTAQAQPQLQPMPPAAAPPATELDKKLDSFLGNWEKKMQALEGLQAKLERTEKDKTFKAESKFVGKAAYLKVKGATAQNLALLEMNIAGKQELHEKIIVTGQFIYQFAPADMKIYATEIPKPKPGQVSQDNFLTLVFGATASDLRARYNLQLSNDKLHPDGEDKYYIYVDVIPKTAADKADFQRAQLVLSKDNFLPRRLWFEAPNKSEILWDITSIDDKAMPKRTDFDAPTPPPGWKLAPVDSKSELPPRIIRPEK
jgi:TIGR03009 family protein